MRNFVTKLWQRFIVGPVLAAEAESRAQSDPEHFDWKSLVVCVVVAFNLAVLQYFGMSDRVGWFINSLSSIGLESLALDMQEAITIGPHARLYSLFYWVGSCFMFYFVIPALVVKLIFREKLTDYGMSLSGAFKHWYVYVLLFLAILPLIIAVSFDEQFQRQYPFFKAYGDTALPEGLIYWELAYGVQFFALEFFFRGFMVHGLKRRMGAFAVVVMAVPYCMIHFGKPFPETIGAIFAGLILGMLSLRTRSIWLGVWIHVSVAWSMDFLSLWQKGLL